MKSAASNNPKIINTAIAINEPSPRDQQAGETQRLPRYVRIYYRPSEIGEAWYNMFYDTTEDMAMALHAVSKRKCWGEVEVRNIDNDPMELIEMDEHLQWAESYMQGAYRWEYLNYYEHVQRTEKRRPGTVAELAAEGRSHIREALNAGGK
ncbi:hypothetical protein KQI84_14405 [bacterium]|nr:hypothetical protein [bacterium]